ncbi:hypothetical protein ACFSJQ_18390 [Vibrio olivae]
MLTYCKIDEMVMTPKMKGYLDRIESKVALGNLLATSVASSQFIELFSGRMSAGKRLKAISEHDWDLFGEVMMSSHIITKNEVNKVADEARLFSSGKEAKFWGCVYDATR